MPVDGFLQMKETKFSAGFKTHSDEVQVWHNDNRVIDIVIRSRKLGSLHQKERILLLGADYYIIDPFIIYLLVIIKTYYIENNPLLNPFVHNKSMLPCCAYDYILICIRKDVILEWGGFDSIISGLNRQYL